MKKIILLLILVCVNLFGAEEYKEKLSSFSDQVSLRNATYFCQINVVKSAVYNEFKQRAFQRGNRIEEMSAYANTDILKVIYITRYLPNKYEDSILTYDIAPVLLEVDYKGNIVSIFVSYIQTFVMFNHVNNPSAPTENSLVYMVLDDQDVSLVKSYLPKRFWDENRL